MMEKLLGLPVLASKHGKDVDNLIIYVHWLMAVLFIGWLAYFAYALFRFRKSKNPKADYVGARTHASTWVEVAVAAVEGILLIGFAVPLWAAVVDSLPNESEATVIRVMAQQFGWNALYPGKDGTFGKQDINIAGEANKFGSIKDDPAGKDDFTTFNDIHVPLNKPVLIHLTSRDVIHSLKVIALRVTQDAMPGMSIPVFFTAITPGRYQINCAQLCGNGHYNMALGFITIESPEEFNKWVAEQKTGGSAASFE
jgi:cytochrome c oxidase subunit 2